MALKTHVIIINNDQPLPNVLQQAADELDLATHLISWQENYSRLITNAFAVVILLDNPDDFHKPCFTQALDTFNQHALPVIVMSSHPIAPNVHSDPIAHLNYVAPDENVDMLKGRLLTLRSSHTACHNLQTELNMLRQLSQPLNQHFTEVSEEMQLASRLQRDFLPRVLPDVPNLRFATIFRPAGWVSGDIYDIMRLDEDHIGFYIADAVGHGMPAALLTMFIKRALVTKVIEGNRYQLVDPGQALRQLNEDLILQELSNFQFVTCCYGILNFKDLTLRVANAGHPLPMHINTNAESDELPVSGRLLGVFPEVHYDTQTFQLQPGEKILLYSDGVEVAFINEGPDKPLRFRSEFGNLANYDVQTMCDTLLDIINREEGSLHPRDDVTIVAIETLSPE